MEFGPQLVGQTEKALNAVLAHLLEPAGVSEPEWVTLRLAGQLPAGEPLAGYVAVQSQLADATTVVAGLRRRGLLDGDVLSSRGQHLVEEVQGAIRRDVAPVWDGVDPADAAAAARALGHVREGCLRLLGTR